MSDAVSGASSPLDGDGRCAPAGPGLMGELILGSASPRRLALLAQVGVAPSAVVPADIDETPAPDELPRVYVARMAREKNAAVDGGESLILTADTVVSAGRRILGKPADEAEAAGFLRLLGGRRHRVSTAICLSRGGERRARVVETRVKMRRLSEDEIAAYLASGEWRGKAGGYAIQGISAAFVTEINGSYTNVVGLPLPETLGLLRSFGYPVNLAGPAA